MLGYLCNIYTHIRPVCMYAHVKKCNLGSNSGGISKGNKGILFFMVSLCYTIHAHIHVYMKIYTHTLVYVCKIYAHIRPVCMYVHEKK